MSGEDTSSNRLKRAMLENFTTAGSYVNLTCESLIGAIIYQRKLFENTYYNYYYNKRNPDGRSELITVADVNQGGKCVFICYLNDGAKVSMPVFIRKETSGTQSSVRRLKNFLK